MPAKVRKESIGALPFGPGSQDPPAGETVLLVEDDSCIRLLVRLALEPHGYRVLAAADGDQALEISRHHLGTIHVVITDIQVPGLRGPELAERIASLRPGIKVLFISGDIAVHAKLPPQAAQLGKPFSPAVLACKVRQVLDA
ncbi:MAG: response regulator [Acidobacteria bacterium]|nr:response regulator [Acidobacteriota bacterium]